MVKLSQIEEYKKLFKKPAAFHRAWGLKRTHGGILRGCPPLEAGFEGAQPLTTFWNLHGFRVPGNDVLALDEVQTVLYTHMVITRFLYQSAGLNERQSICPKKPRSQQFSGFSSEMGVANSVVMTCPETLTHQLKRVLV